MSVPERLGYRHRRPNAVFRAMRAIASTRWGAWLFSRSIRPIDDLLLRLTKGKVTAPGLLAGLPVVSVTTTGARSGRPRTVPLVGVPVGGELAIIGTNFGQVPTPAWYYNLRANPDAEVSYRGARVAVHAREVVGAERDDIWRIATEVYVGYAAYRRRITGRDVHIMMLAEREEE